jgi:hypothetical protein
LILFKSASAPENNTRKKAYYSRLLNELVSRRGCDSKDH